MQEGISFFVNPLRRQSKADIIIVLPFSNLTLGRREEVCAMEEILTSFLVSVIASVAGNCVSKWLDRHRKGK